MAKLRDLVNRRKAVRNIRKITRTMELIATARFKKAMDRAAEAAAYTKKIAELAADLTKGGGRPARRDSAPRARPRARAVGFQSLFPFGGVERRPSHAQAC